MAAEVKVVVLVSYLISHTGAAEGPSCAFGFADAAKGEVWELCEQFRLQRSLTEPVPAGYLRQSFICELRPALPASGYCFGRKTRE
jgi:hypothetical protein